MWLALARLVWLGKILARSFKKFGSLSLPQFTACFISLSLPLTGLCDSHCAVWMHADSATVASSDGNQWRPSNPNRVCHDVIG